MSRSAFKRYHDTPSQASGYVPDALTHCSPRRVSFLDTSSFESRKFRRTAMESPSQSNDNEGLVSLGSGAPLYNFESQETATQFIDRWLAQSKAQQSHQPMGTSSPPPSPTHAPAGLGGMAALEAMVFAPAKKSKKFTRAEVEALMREREAQLKEEFIHTLNSLMAGM